MPVSQNAHARTRCVLGLRARSGEPEVPLPGTSKGTHLRWASRVRTGRQIRIPLCEDRRVFTPVARSSHTWSRLYDMRTAVERVNSRIDGAFMFEHHYIRGKAKMEAG